MTHVDTCFRTSLKGISFDFFSSCNGDDPNGTFISLTQSSTRPPQQRGHAIFIVIADKSSLTIATSAGRTNACLLRFIFLFPSDL